METGTERSTRRTDPGNPREHVLSTAYIYPGEGDLAEYRVPLTIKGEYSEEGMTLDAAGPEDAKRVVEAYLAAKFVPRSDYEIHEPIATGGEVSWTGPRHKG